MGYHSRLIFLRRQFGKCHQKRDRGGRANRDPQNRTQSVAQSKSDIFDQNVSGGHHRHEDRGQVGEPPASATARQKYGSGPERHCGECLVGPTKIAPDNLEIDEVKA